MKHQTPYRLNETSLSPVRGITTSLLHLVERSFERLLNVCLLAECLFIGLILGLEHGSRYQIDQGTLIFIDLRKFSEQKSA